MSMCSYDGYAAVHKGKSVPGFRKLHISCKAFVKAQADVLKKIMASESFFYIIYNDDIKIKITAKMKI